MQRMGFKCPEDLSIVSGSDSALVKWHSPSITTYSNIHCYQQGFSGAELLLDILDGKVSYLDAFQIASDIKIPAKLIERGSVANIKNIKG